MKVLGKVIGKFVKGVVWGILCKFVVVLWCVL